MKKLVIILAVIAVVAMLLRHIEKPKMRISEIEVAAWLR